MRKNKEYSYFKAFIQLAQYSQKANEILKQTLHNYTPDHLDDKLVIMHEVEHNADIAKHELFNRLAKEFLPPLDREDIVRLSELLDDVTDAVEDVLININILNLKTVPQEFIEFSEVIDQCCQELISLLVEFENYKKSKELQSIIIKVNRLEEYADKLYINGVRKLFSTTSDPIKLMVWKEIYESLEKCCDSCENAANYVGSIVMKNS